MTCACAGICALATPGAALAEVEPGTRISNVALLTADRPGGGIRTTSNEVALIVAERLDVTLTAQPGADGAPLAFDLANTGNGREGFRIRVATADPSVTVRATAIDRDGDGRFDPTRDMVVDGATQPLAAGEHVRLLVLLDAPGFTRTSVTVTAAALTVSGAPGRTVGGAGDGGGDAIVGPTGASASATVDVAAPTSGSSSGGSDGATLVKSQAVLAPDGSARAVHDAIVTYTLVARFAAAVSDARIDDPVPAGTLYVPGSLRLDAAPLSDAADTDSGSADGRAIAVALGDAPAGSSRTVQFQVRIP